MSVFKNKFLLMHSSVCRLIQQSAIYLPSLTRLYTRESPSNFGPFGTGSRVTGHFAEIFHSQIIKMSLFITSYYSTLSCRGIMQQITLQSLQIESKKSISKMQLHISIRKLLALHFPRLLSTLQNLEVNSHFNWSHYYYIPQYPVA